MREQPLAKLATAILPRGTVEDALLTCCFAAAPLAACWGGADPWVSIVRPGLRRISSYAGFAHLGSRGDDGLLGWAWEVGLGLRLG